MDKIFEKLKNFEKNRVILNMAYLGTKSFEDLQHREKVIDPFYPKRLKSSAYELSLGSEVFRTDSKDRKKEILKDSKEQIIINPGQFALLLTEEIIKVPKDKIAFISIKAGIKLRGLVNVSGFHVDPGFHGKLVFSVYNAGSGQISLEKGKPSFLIWFAELSEIDIKPYKGDHNDQDSIPLRYVDDLTKTGELASPNVLLEKINENKTTLETKVGLIEKEQKAIDYIVKIGIGFLIVILAKFLLEWTMFKSDNDYQKKYFETNSKLDSLSILFNNNVKTLENISLKLDSITTRFIKLKIEVDSLKKKK